MCIFQTRDRLTDDDCIGTTFLSLHSISGQGDEGMDWKVKIYLKKYIIGRDPWMGESSSLETYIYTAIRYTFFLFRIPSNIWALLVEFLWFTEGVFRPSGWIRWSQRRKGASFPAYSALFYSFTLLNCDVKDHMMLENK